MMKILILDATQLMMSSFLCQGKHDWLIVLRFSDSDNSNTHPMLFHCLSSFLFIYLFIFGGVIILKFLYLLSCSSRVKYPTNNIANVYEDLTKKVSINFDPRTFKFQYPEFYAFN